MMSVGSVENQAVRTALGLVAWPHAESSIGDVTEINSGVNDVYTFSTGLNDPERAVCKFATFSDPVAFQAGATASRQLAACTELPVPDVYALRPAPIDLPAFQILELLPGEPLPGHPDPGDPGPARALGRVIAELGAVPPDRTDGYGWIQPGGVERTAELPGRDRSVTGEYATCSEWLLQYGLELYSDPPAHDALAATVQAVPPFLRANSDRFPDAPHSSIVLTDFGPGNLLAPGGTVSADGSLVEITGLVDLERAKLGPMAFNAVNAEFLMQRSIHDPEPVISAMYDPLPFGPDLPRRDLYRLLAMGREVGALDLWYEVGSQTHERRGNALAREIEQIVT